MSDGSALEVNTLALFSSNDEGSPPSIRSGASRRSRAARPRSSSSIATTSRRCGSSSRTGPRCRRAARRRPPRSTGWSNPNVARSASPLPAGRRYHISAARDARPGGANPNDRGGPRVRGGQEPTKAEDAPRAPRQVRGAAALWARWFADLTRVREESMTKEGAAILHHYLYATLKYHRPVDRAVRKLLTSTGSPYDETSGAGFMLSAAGPKELMEHVTRSFLGIRLQCAQCHQHPFDRWSRDDYYGAASFFSRVLVRPEDHFVVLDSFGELTDPRSGGDARCKLPGNGDRDGAAPRSPGAVRELAPRSHGDAFPSRHGKSRVEATIRSGAGRAGRRPARRESPSHPELLDALALMLRDNNCDWLRFVSLIMESDAYARSTAILPGNERDRRHASHASPRPLPAAVALDAIADACGIKLSFPGDSEVTRAVNVRDEDGGSYTLRVLGTCPRDGTRDPGSPPFPRFRRRSISSTARPPTSGSRPRGAWPRSSNANDRPSRR